MPAGALAGSDGNCGFQRERSREYRQPAQDNALVFGEQLVAPVERRAERSLARQRSARSAREKKESIGEPGIDLFDGERACARGSELERQRNAVEMNADLGNDTGAIGGQLERRKLRLKPFHEKLDRFGAI